MVCAGGLEPPFPVTVSRLGNGAGTRPIGSCVPGYLRGNQFLVPVALGAAPPYPGGAFFWHPEQDLNLRLQLRYGFDV